MKAEQYNLINSDVVKNLVARLYGLPPDGKTKVVISDAGNKSARQRGLEWMWYTEVSYAGVGGKHEDSKEGVHLVSKWRWAKPIIIRDDPFFAELFAAWEKMHGEDEDAMMWFCDKQIKTEEFSTSQMAEYLTDFERHYRPHVNLTDPQLMGLSTN